MLPWSLRGCSYGLAREQAHFKLEQVRPGPMFAGQQPGMKLCTLFNPAHLALPSCTNVQEADVQRHRQRLVKEGKLPEEEAARAAEEAARRAKAKDFTASEHSYEARHRCRCLPAQPPWLPPPSSEHHMPTLIDMLPSGRTMRCVLMVSYCAAPPRPLQVLSEVLQQQSRVDDPDALRRRQYERRVRGEPPPLSEAELLRARWVGGGRGREGVVGVAGRVGVCWQSECLIDRAQLMTALGALLLALCYGEKDSKLQPVPLRQRRPHASGARL
jgi:hypothetical protein